MSQITLKWLRFITPGVLILVFNGILGELSGQWAAFWPKDIKEAVQSLSAFVIAGVYYLLPFRSWANKRHFDDVTENIRFKMVRIAGLQDDKEIFHWTNIRGIFWHFIDNDKSLSAKSNLAYFNGFIWTTMADIRVIALLHGFGGLTLWQLLRSDGALLAAILFFLLALLSLGGSVLITQRHKEIGNEQLEIIEQEYQSDLKTRLEAVRERSNS